MRYMTLPASTSTWVLPRPCDVGRRDGFTDDVVVTLQEVSGILYLLGIQVHRDAFLPTDFMEAHSDIVSLFGVKALVDRELAHIKRLDGKLQEAFDIAFDSFVSAEDVWEAVDWDDVDLFRQFLIQVNGEERLALEEETRAAIRRCLPLYEATATSGLLREAQGPGQE